MLAESRILNHWVTDSDDDGHNWDFLNVLLDDHIEDLLSLFLSLIKCGLLLLLWLLIHIIIKIFSIFDLGQHFISKSSDSTDYEHQQDEMVESWDK